MFTVSHVTVIGSHDGCVSQRRGIPCTTFSGDAGNGIFSNTNVEDETSQYSCSVTLSSLPHCVNTRVGNVIGLRVFFKPEINHVH